MDIRTHKLGEYNKKLGGFVVQPEYEKDVADFLESNREEFDSQNQSGSLSEQISKAYQHKEPLSFQVWEDCRKRYVSSTHANIFSDRPITLAVLGLRDFSVNLDAIQKEWCVNIISSTIVTIIQDAFRMDFGLNISYNPMEKEIALSSFHLLFAAISSADDRENLISLMVYMLFAPLGDHEIVEIAGYLRGTFFRCCPVEGRKVWYSLIRYSEFRKSNPYFYDDHDTDRLQDVKQLESKFIKEVVQSNDYEFQLSHITLQSHEGYLLTRAFIITPYNSNDQYFSSFIEHFIALLTEDLKLRENYSYNRRDKERQISFQAAHDAQEYIIELLVNANSAFSRAVLHLVVKPIYGIDNRRSADDLFTFVRDTIEGVIFKVEGIISKTVDDKVKNELTTNFWLLWEELFQIVKSSGKSYFTPLLFLDARIKWDNSLMHWAPLTEKKTFYYQMVKEFGATNAEAIINVFSTVGEKTFLPEGLSWIVDILKNNESQNAALLSVASERLIKRLFYNHISVIKTNKRLINDFVWILNKMIDLGSSEAYLFRENVITYKNSH
jgi:hypothetical protein